MCFTVAATKGEHLGDRQAVRYDKIITNIGNGYDSRDGHFSAPVSGIYTFTVTGMGIGTSTIWLAIVKNDIELARVYTTTDDADSSSVTAHTHLNQGDRVWIQNAGPSGSQTHPGTYNYFSGILEQAD